MVIERLHTISYRTHAAKRIKENKISLKQVMLLQEFFYGIGQTFFTPQISHKITMYFCVSLVNRITTKHSYKYQATLYKKDSSLVKNLELNNKTSS